MATIEVAGISVVAAGAFNPAIFHPSWLAEKGLLPSDLVEEALKRETITTRQLAAYTVDWLSVQVTQEQAVFATADEGREFDLRDLAKAVLDLLPETPIDAVGINSDAHFRAASEEDWHAIGDQFLPKDFWQPLFEGEEWIRRANGLSVGMRSLAVEAWRNDIAGFVRTEIAPSVRLAPNGIYTGVNSHFQLSGNGKKGNGYEAARIIEMHWDATRALERELIDRLIDVA